MPDEPELQNSYLGGNAVETGVPAWPLRQGAKGRGSAPIFRRKRAT
jgi:hypothetical protein